MVKTLFIFNVRSFVKIEKIPYRKKEMKTEENVHLK